MKLENVRKNMKKSSKLSVILLSLGSMILPLLSCGENSGLGSSVDTEAPKISITYPPAAAIISGTFEFGGTWTDDKKVNNITVTVSKIVSDSQKNIVYTEEVTPDGNSTWKTSLNKFDSENSSYYNGWQFSDGNYEISAVAHDNAGNNSGTASHSYSIDNTAPILVLTKPTSLGSQNPKGYGRTVQLEGTFSESCISGISKLTVSFFDENGKGISDVDFTDINDMSGANPLVLAKFYDKDERDSLSGDNLVRWNLYKELYGEDNVNDYDNLSSSSSDAVTKKLYFTLTASDAAKSYNDFKNLTSTESGNTTSIYYYDTDVMHSLINGQNDDFKNFTVLTLRNYICKTDNTYLNNTELQNILSTSECKSLFALNESAADGKNTIDTSDFLTFTINPQNNPTFTVSGLEIKESGSADTYTESNGKFYRHYYTGSTINVSILRGPDESALFTKTISIYYIKEGETEKHLLWTYNEDEAVKYAMSKDPSLTEAAAKSLVSSSAAQAKANRYTITSETENADSLSFSTSLSNTDVTTGSNYTFVIVGTDNDGQEVIKSASNGFGFFAKANSNVPVITLDSYDSENPNSNLSNLSTFDNNAFVNDKIKFSGSVFTSDRGTSGQTGYYYDNKCDNVSYTVTLTDTKNSSNSVTLGPVKAGTNGFNFNFESGTGYNFKWDFEFSPSSPMTNLITSGSKLYTIDVTVSAINGGGTTTVTRTYYLDTQKPELTNVTITRDENSDGTKVYYNNSSSIYYINNTSNTFAISGTATDNYQINKTWYEITGIDESGSAKTLTLDEDKYSELMQWTFSGIDLSGFKAQADQTDLIITVKSEDKAGNQIDSIINIEFDTKGPEWTAENNSHPFLVNKATYNEATSWYKDKNLPLSGCYIEKASGISDIYYYVKKSTDETGPDTSSISSANGSFKATNDSANGLSYFTNQNVGSFEASEINGNTITPNILYLVAYDNVGNKSTEKEIKINLDVKSPTLKSDKSGVVYTNKNNAIQLNGTYSDNVSGGETLVIKVNGKESNASLAPDSENSPNGSWSATLTKEFIDSVFTDENTTSYPLNATIKDKAGNAGSMTIFTLTVDTEAPVFTLAKPNITTINSKVDLQGSVSYEGAEPNTLVLYYATEEPNENTSFNESNKINQFTTTSEPNLYSWSVSSFDVYTKAGITETAPSKPLYLVADVDDAAGNKKRTIKEFNVDQNSDRPVIKLTEIASADSWLKTQALTGTIKDDDGIKTFEISVKYKGEDFGSYETISVSNENWTYNFVTGKDSDDIKIKFRVTDSENTVFESGNTSLFKRPYYLYSGTTESSEEVTGQNTWTDYGLDKFNGVVIESLPIKLDTQDPAIYTVGLDIEDSSTFVEATSIRDDTVGKYKASLSRYAGGNYKYIKLFLPVFDANFKEAEYKITAEGSDTPLASANLTLVTDADSKPVTVNNESNTITYSYYASEAIDVSSWDSGACTVTFTASDKAGNTSKTTASFTVDNDGPDQIDIISPSSEESLTGDIEVSGTVSDSGIGNVSKIEWLIPRKADLNDTSKDVNSYEGWTANNSGSTSAFKFAFKTGTETDLTVYDNETLYGVTKNNDDTYSIPVYFRATDSLGNTYVYDGFHLTHNPDGDRPKTELSYPVEKDYDSDQNYITLSGGIQVTGSVEIPSLTCDVGTVFIQIGTVDENGTPDFTYSTLTDKIKNEITNLCGTATSYNDLVSEYVTEITTKEELHYNDTSWWGIPATTKSSSWSIILNNSKNLNPDDGNPTTQIAIRAAAINENGKLGIWTAPVFVHIDNNAPSQTPEIRTYTSFNSASLDSNVKLSKNYSSAMYLRGEQYLVIKVEDNDSIDPTSLNIKRGSTRLSENTDYYRTTPTNADEANDIPAVMYVYVPINTKQLSNSVSYTVYITDTAGHSSSMTYSFRIDNTAPEISKLYGNDENNENLLAIPAAGIQNSNYRYRIQSSISEIGSGFDKFFFQFIRKNVTDSSKPRVLDIKLSGNSYYNTTYTEALDTFTVSQKEINDSGDEASLYGKSYTGELNAARTTFTATGIKDDSHIRKGGLIYIGGEYQVITSISGNAVTFATSVPESVEPDISSVTAGFPYGQVIDNTNDKSTWNDSAHTYSVPEDDDDGMAESVSKAGTVWTLLAGFDSSLMNDGPVTLVCVAFDNAGNISVKEVDTMIQNNAPRLAKLHLGTDLSGDGKYAYATAKGDLNEFNTYTFVTGENGKATASLYQKSVNFETAGITYANYGTPFIIKNGLAVVPEITGGNGTIKMKFLADASTETDHQTDEEENLYSVDTTNKVTGTFSTLTNSTKNTADTTPAFIINDTNLTNITDGSGKAMSFTFWDSTEGTKIGSDSNYCFIRVSDFTVDLVDSKNPETNIDPFYWKSLTDNSIYGSSSATSYSDLQGHIELEADLSTSDKTLGTDPKVSGKVTFKGYAYDDQRLTSLWIAFDGFTPSNYLDSETTTSGGTTYYKAALYNTTGENAGKWTKAPASMESNGWEFAIDDKGTDEDAAYLNQSGHKVFWTLSIDTARISTVAAKDRSVRVLAQDRTPNSANKNYQMDVVPYITGINTSLSSVNANNPTVFSRSALGHYPVYMTQAGNFAQASATKETITLTGFNLGSDSVTTTVTFANNDKTGNTAATTTFKSSAYSFALPAGAKSGELSVSVNGIVSRNNLNNNEAHGSYELEEDVTADSLSAIGESGDITIYKNFYNRQPNDANNNRLTDDVYVDVWQFNSSAVIPTDNSALDIMMKINPSTGVIGFAFNSGALKAAMPGSSNSYQSISGMSDNDFHQCTGFAFAGDGTAYATNAGGESDASVAARYYFCINAASKFGIGFTAVDDINNMAKDRFKSPSIVANSDGSYVYIAYFDLLANEIRFMGGKSGDKGYGSENGAAIKNNYTNNNWSNNYTTTYEQKLVQVLADGEGNSLGYAGEYVSIGISKNHVVMTWYDAKNNNLMYAYSDEKINPSTGINSNGWTKVQTPLLEGAGKYCQLAVGGDGSIHIASYDSANGDLKYVYLKDYTGAEKKTCTVDSYLSVGKELTIDVASNGTYQIPYIGYYGSTPKKPRYAYLAEPAKFYAGTATDGVDTDAYTGVWECTIVPSASTITVDATRRINVGVWKTTAGVLDTSKTGTSSSSAGSGTIYGNGTNNPVLGYGVRYSSSVDYGETAQKR